MPRGISGVIGGVTCASTAWVVLTILALLAGWPSAVHAEARVYSFGVLPQRSAVLTAQYWNPILDYIWQKADVNLQLKITHTAPECNEAISRGEYDFVYSNTIFEPQNMLSGYRVIVRPEGESITGEIVTLEDAPVKSLGDLQGRTVGFPSPIAFAGYVAPMLHLRREGVHVIPRFGGNQEGIMAQLKTGSVIAAAVNSEIMQSFAAREGLRYRVLWRSRPYLNLPVAVHPRIDKSVADAVQKTLAGMDADPEGMKILAESAAVTHRKAPYGFLAATQEEYRDYIDTYRAALETENN